MKGSKQMTSKKQHEDSGNGGDDEHDDKTFIRSHAQKGQPLG
jgi:hypothetical protein